MISDLKKQLLNITTRHEKAVARNQDLEGMLSDVKVKWAESEQEREENRQEVMQKTEALEEYEEYVKELENEVQSL
jgi:chromosome segregation ATPase